MRTQYSLFKVEKENRPRFTEQTDFSLPRFECEHPPWEMCEHHPDYEIVDDIFIDVLNTR